ncbi:MAG TPA: hypothetical protein VFN19_08160, partial [Candidatus Nanopelagicales bacterium]|nr:hypothetical protein [Candidatus Nanopelagicales bacterium]
DVDAIRRFGRLTDAQLIEILADRDPGYDRRIFAGQLGLVAQVTATEAARYGIGAEDLAAVRQRLTAWARELRS